MAFLQETEHERTMRRIVSCTHTLQAVIDDLDDPADIDARADLLIAAENLIEAALYVTDACRGIAWQYSPIPYSEEDEESDYD